MKLEDIEEDEIGKQMINYFNVFIGEEPEEEGEEQKTAEANKKDFKVMSELHSSTKNMRNGEQTMFEDILYCFLEKVFDKFSEEKLNQHLPTFITEMSKSKTIGKAGFNNGISRFVQLICQLAVDIPFICKVFANCVIVPLIELDMIDFSKIKWHVDSAEGEGEDDLDDFREVEAHYKVMAHLIHKYPYMNKDWLSKSCPVLLSEEESLKHILEHAQLIKDIEEDLGVEEAKAEELCALMGLDKNREMDI